MILVDTSVWIDYFNGKEDIHTEILDYAIVDGTVAIGDIIYLEILQGFSLIWQKPSTIGFALVSG